VGFSLIVDAFEAMAREFGMELVSTGPWEEMGKARIQESDSSEMMAQEKSRWPPEDRPPCPVSIFLFPLHRLRFDVL
jgi:hypothetical protein